MHEYLDFRNYLEKLKENEAYFRKKLRSSPAGEIGFYKRSKNEKEYTDFYVKVQGQESRKYINKNKKLIEDLIWKLYYKIQLDKVNKNISLIEHMLLDYQSTAFENIIEEMNPEFQKIILKGRKNKLLLSQDPMRAKKVLDWVNAPTEVWEGYPNELKHKTSVGIFTRSKSEALIVEKLNEYGIAFKYEQQIYLQSVNKYVRPDFIIMRSDGKIFIWEHCGKWDDENYKMRFKEKINDYIDEGIVLWDNLILTFDSPDGIIDVNIIEAEIKNKLIV